MGEVVRWNISGNILMTGQIIPSLLAQILIRTTRLSSHKLLGTDAMRAETLVQAG